MSDEERARHIAHYDKFLPHVHRLHVSFDHAASLPEIVAAVGGLGDIWLNSIPLRRWDAYHAAYAYNSRGLGWSLSDSVCTAKLAALVAALKVLGGDDMPLSTGADIQRAIEALTPTV